MGILGSNLVVVSLVQFHSLVFMDLAQGHRVTSYLSRMCHTCHSYGHEISDMAEIEICNTMFHVSDAILDNLPSNVSDAILDNLPSNVSITLGVRLNIVKMYADDQTSLLV